MASDPESILGTEAYLPKTDAVEASLLGVRGIPLTRCVVVVLGCPVPPRDIPGHHTPTLESFFGEQTGSACPPHGLEVRPEIGELVEWEPLGRIRIGARVETEDRHELSFVGLPALLSVVRDRFEDDEPLERLVGC